MKQSKTAVRKRPVTRTVKPSTKPRATVQALFCEHANEVPARCPCAPDCYCKTHTCARVYATDADIAELARDVIKVWLTVRPKTTATYGTAGYVVPTELVRVLDVLGVTVRHAETR